MKRYLLLLCLIMMWPTWSQAQISIKGGKDPTLSVTTLTVTGATALQGSVTITGTVIINNTIAANDVITVTVSDAATTTVTDVLKLIHNTSDTPAAGLGTGLQFQVEDLGGDEEQASIDVFLTTVTDGAEDVDVLLNVNSGGAITEGLRVVGAAGEVYTVVGGKESGQALQALTVESQGPNTSSIGVSQDTSQNVLCLIGSTTGNAGTFQLRTHNNVADIALISGGGESYINSGSFGIGTITPTNKFEVVLDSDGEVGDSTVFVNSAGQLVLPMIGNNPTRPSLAFGDANTGLYENPDNTLHVVINGQAAGTYNFSGTSFRATLSGGPELMEEAATATNPTLNPYGGVFTTGIGGDASGNLSVITNSASRIYAAVGGNVGIGTTAPTNLLTLKSSTAPQMNIVHTTGADSTTFGVDANGDLTVVPSGGDFIVTGNSEATTYGSDASVSDAELLYVGDVTSAIQAQIDNKLFNNADDVMTGSLTLQENDPGVVFDESTASDTDFWIGNNADQGGDDDDKFQIGKGTTIGTTPYITMDKDGNVGIAGDQIALLTVGGNLTTDDVEILVIGDRPAYHVALGFSAGGNTEGFIGNTYDNVAGRFDIRMRGTEGSDAKVTVLGSGNVGVGVVGPEAMIHIEGASADTLAGLKLTNTTGNNAIEIQFQISESGANGVDWFMMWDDEGNVFSMGERVGGKGSETINTQWARDGGMIVGTPTGGDKGAGTINANAVYDDNTLLGPDFVFEDDYKELNIVDTKKYYEKNKHLPTMPKASENIGDTRKSVGEIVMALWETIEVQQKHISQLQQQIDELKEN